MTSDASGNGEEGERDAAEDSADNSGSTGLDEIHSGCDTCDSVNLANAVYGTLQLTYCDDNDIDSIEEAIELVEEGLAEVTEM